MTADTHVAKHRKSQIRTKKTIQPDHISLSKMKLKMGKNQISFRIRGNFDREYIITARIFLYDNKHPRKVQLTRSSFRTSTGRSLAVTCWAT